MKFPFWLYFDQIILTIDYLMIFFVGILHFASCPNLKMDTKETLSASAFGRVEPFSLLTYFDWLLKWNQMADQFSSDLAIFQLLQKSVFNLNFDLDNIFDQTLVFKYHIQSRKRRVLISQTFLNTMYMWLLWALFRYFWSWQIQDFNEHRRRTFRVLLFSELSKEF